MIIEKVNEPKDLKNLNIETLNTLSDEMRKLIIKKVNTIGGHFGPNLGMIEATIAMHYVFNSPVDKFIFDVSHQCYPHKILTRRKEGFMNPDKYLKYTGYTAPAESSHDLFTVGHTSTSVSLATGVAKIRDLKGEKYNVIALIGDGSLTGGEALEGLNNAAVLGSNIIIIVNDNDMSIATNHGGLYNNLRQLRETDGLYEQNMFKTFGFDYYFVKDGNNIQSLINTFEKVKDIQHPTVVHICTEKGHGCQVAVENKEMFHWIMPNTLDENEHLIKREANNSETYENITNNYILEKAKQDKTIVAINAATPGVFGFTQDFRNKLGSQYVDVGIAEEHATAFTSAIAKQGGKPILAIMSSFIQRTYDQLSQDMCLNNSPATILVYWGGISPADCTHLCTFDIPLISNIPNLVYLAPTNKEEHLAMLDWAVNQTKHPVAIRVPTAPLISSGIKDETDYSILNKYKIEKNGEKVAIIGLGNFLNLAKETALEIKNTLGIDPTIINPRFITGIDKELLTKIQENHSVVITLEDGVVDGGFGEKITRFYGKAKNEFTDRIALDELYKKYHLTKELITNDIKEIL